MYRCEGGTWRLIELHSDIAYPKTDQAKVSVYGYRPSQHSVQTWEVGLTVRGSDGEHHVSCKENGTEYGVCHNSVQYCINKEFGKKGYIIRCHNGVLEHYNDTTEHYIACNCVSSNGNNGGCSTSRSCYSAQTATLGIEMCRPPSNTTSGYGDDNFVEDSGNFSCSQ